MVLKYCGNNDIPGFPRKSAGDHRDSFSGVFHKYRGAPFPVDEGGNLLVGMPVLLACNPCQAVNTPADIGPVCPLKLIHCSKDTFRSKGRCGIVKINQITNHRELTAQRFPVRNWTFNIHNVSGLALRHEMGNRRGGAAFHRFFGEIEACFTDQLLHFGRKLLPPPQTPADKLRRKSSLGCPAVEELIPSGCHCRMGFMHRCKL